LFPKGKGESCTNPVKICNASNNEIKSNARGEIPGKGLVIRREGISTLRIHSTL